VLVEVVGAGLCHSDLSVIEGTRPRPVPIVLGHEAAGIVREVGAGVSEFKPDDHVIFSWLPSCGHCLYCASGRPSLCENGSRANVEGTLLNGSRHFRDQHGQVLNQHQGVSGFSHFTVVVPESLVKIPQDVPLEKAALVGCAILTGVGAVVNTARVEAGVAVAVWGLGGVGLSVVMGARLAGAHPIIAVDIIQSKLDLALKLGASHVINAKQDDPVQVVRDLTGGGVAYTFDTVGSERSLQQVYDACRRGGTTVTIALPHPTRMFTAPAVHIVGDERTIKGSYMGSAIPRRDIPRFMALYQAGLLPVDLLFTRTITLDEINGAFDALAKGEAVRQVLVFN
jgi:Zn-dependent alcohol dehydrogenase